MALLDDLPRVGGCMSRQLFSRDTIVEQVSQEKPNESLTVSVTS